MLAPSEKMLNVTRVCLTIEYDGTAYHGWQMQPNTRGRTIQAMLEKALETVLKHPVKLYSSGRTDAGVHALGMKAHFDTETHLPLSAYRQGVNSWLPQDISVVEAVFVPDTFHARFDALKKHYRYSIYTSSMRSPLKRLYAWQVPAQLDVEAMRAAAVLLEGRHDFAAFRSSSCMAATTERTLESVTINVQDGFVLIDIFGDGFLKNMVRIITGALFAVGMYKITAIEIDSMLKTKVRPLSVITAPACGLSLMQVYY
jgi:tRNA pseudouridine38-40 synthase